MGFIASISRYFDSKANLNNMRLCLNQNYGRIGVYMYQILSDTRHDYIVTPCEYLDIANDEGLNKSTLDCMVYCFNPKHGMLKKEQVESFQAYLNRAFFENLSKDFPGMYEKRTFKNRYRVKVVGSEIFVICYNVPNSGQS